CGARLGQLASPTRRSSDLGGLVDRLPGPVTDKPAIEGLPVNELVAGLRVILGQQPQGNVVVRRAALHEGQQFVAQLVIFGPLARSEEHTLNSSHVKNSDAV